MFDSQKVKINHIYNKHRRGDQKVTALMLQRFNDIRY